MVLIGVRADDDLRYPRGCQGMVVMPTVYRSNPLSRDIKPMMETMKRGFISEEIKNLRPPHIVQPKRTEQKKKEQRLVQEQAPTPPPIPIQRPVIIERGRKPGIYPEPNKAEVLKLVAEGRSYGRIAAILGTTRSTIAGIVYRERHK